MFPFAQERAQFYPRAIPISATAVIALWVLRAPAFALRGALVTLFLLIVAALVNFGIKLSLHALFAFYSAIILFMVNPVAGAIAFALAVARLLVAPLFEAPRSSGNARGNIPRFGGWTGHGLVAR